MLASLKEDLAELDKKLYEGLATRTTVRIMRLEHEIKRIKKELEEMKAYKQKKEDELANIKSSMNNVNNTNPQTNTTPDITTPIVTGKQIGRAHV